ncbi:hypothetical protein B0T21DRAFT_196440 [Apiosordaria backusii]|uniref:C2H2-type domain-containing protein n=1 Tax=Apiosordaria backusii TaxID=314023 RepID=A0AA40BDX7_9PEZI|nr:hypothetical protein B0T21DRAFT_196440 [Apiosordaria backusii]
MAESSIYDLHIDCMDAFRQLRESLKSFHWSSQVPQTALKLRAVEEELDRYQLWATNTGAASPRQEFSLDFRLQETELLRGQTIRLLQSLRRTIMRASSVATGPLQPTLSALAFPENSIDDTGLVEKFDSDSPWDTSDDADSSEGMEINRDASTQHEGVMGQGIINQIPQCVADVDQLLGTIKYTVICLYRLPLRRPAAVDRAKWVTDELGDVSLFQHFDILYVKDKFPNAQTALLERLGKLISRRRLLLKYRTTHAQKLRLVASSRTEPQVHRQPEPVESPPTHEAPARWKGKQPMNISSSLSTSDRLTTRTKASFLKRDEDIIDPRQLYAPSVASSRLSAASTYTTSQDLHFPPRPTDDEGEPLTHFECPYCGITQYITSSQAWESHVIRDLQPYVCTFDSCDSGDQLFSSRSDWFNHEIQLHRAIWSCKTCPPTASSSHPYLAFENETDFKEHMIHVHGSGTRMTTRMLEAFCQPLLVQDGICCLCGRHAEKLKNHLGRHLEQISLFALPRPEPTAALGMDSVIIGVANQGGSYDELLKGTAGSSWRTASDRESESYKDPLHTAHNPLFEGQSRPGRERKNPLTDLRLLYPERGDADAQVE